MIGDNIQYVFHTRVAQIEQRSEVVRGFKDPTGQAILETQDLGWFILYEGSKEMLFIGNEKPAFEVGDEIEIIQRRRYHDDGRTK